MPHKPGKCHVLKKSGEKKSPKKPIVAIAMKLKPSLAHNISRTS